jgi:predicted phage terminase large subunit-like protein
VNASNLDISSLNQQQILRQLDKLDAEDSLLDFIAGGWHVLEPGREFVPNWHIEAICDHLTAVTKGEIVRLLINVPPGCMKSLTTDVFWPAWEWGPQDMPSTRYVSSSYSQDLTIRDNRRTRTLISSDWYQSLWGDRFRLIGEQNAKTRFDTDQTGFKIATSVGGLGTGERGDRVIIDDPHNVKEGESELKRLATLLWFTEVMPTRVNDPEKSAMIMIMQRVHNQDLSGYIIAEELGYEHLMLPMELEPERKCYSTVKPSYIDNPEKVKVNYNRYRQSWQESEIDESEFPQEIQGLPVVSEDRYAVDPREDENELLWPDRMTRTVVERDKKVMGSYATAGQFQQRPSPRGGGLFQRDWFMLVDEPPPRVIQRVRGWDLAASEEVRGKPPAWTVGVRMSRDHQGIFYVEHMIRFRKSPGDVEDSILGTAGDDGRNVKVSIPQDPGQSGKSQVRAFASLLAGYDVRFSPESGSKEARAIPFAAQAEAGNVRVVRGPWNGAFFDEICEFPASKFKDITDATSRAFSDLIPKKRVKGVPAAPVTVELANG